jgi:hypothetical protein
MHLGEQRLAGTPAGAIAHRLLELRPQRDAGSVERFDRIAAQLAPLPEEAEEADYALRGVRDQLLFGGRRVGKELEHVARHVAHGPGPEIDEAVVIWRGVATLPVEHRAGDALTASQDRLRAGVALRKAGEEVVQDPVVKLAEARIVARAHCEGPGTRHRDEASSAAAARVVAARRRSIRIPNLRALRGLSSTVEGRRDDRAHGAQSAPTV